MGGYCWYRILSEFNFNILPNYIYTNGDDSEAAIRILKRNVGLSED